MPEMVTLEKVLCRSAPWRWATRSLVLPWALQGVEPRGRVLEIGGGSGAMAAAIAERHPQVDITTVDVDPQMVDIAGQRLAPYGRRGTARQADATSLPFEDGSFDTALTFLMLHHVGDWRTALHELARVLTPGGTLIGYDLLDTRPVRAFHRLEGGTVAPATATDLRTTLDTIGLTDIATRLTPGHLLARFTARKAS